MPSARFAPSAALQTFVDAFHGGVCYGIEWAISESNCLECKSYYNPPWRIEAVQKKGLEGLYTTESSTYTFMPGEGLVGKAFATQENLFSEDLQALASDDISDAMFLGNNQAFLRVDLAKKFGIHSALFMPTANGVLEVGSTQKVASSSDLILDRTSYERITRQTSPPAPCSAILEQIVEKSGGGCYGIEWTFSKDGLLKCKSYYNPQWRIEGARLKGLQGLYTSKSTSYTFMPGEGFVGKAFANQEVLFSDDLQEVARDDMMDAMSLGDNRAFLHVDLARKFGIHSAVFMPMTNGVLEVGSTEKVACVSALLSGATAVLHQVISTSVLEIAGLG